MYRKFESVGSELQETQMPVKRATRLRTPKRTTKPAKPRAPKPSSHPHTEADTTLWTEALFGAEVLLLHAAPVYYGFGIPDGDGSAVMIIPGFLGTQL